MAKLFNSKNINFILMLCITFFDIQAKGKINTIINKKIDAVSYFVDRDKERKRIEQNLKQYRTSSIVGMSGIGKTEVARKYAFSHSDEYELIWFFDASLDLNEQFASLARQINRNILRDSADKLSDTLKDSMRVVMDYLSTQNKYLLVFDNLRLGENHKVNKILNWDHEGHVIICSQDSDNLSHIVYIHNLDHHNSSELLRKILNTDSAGVETFKKLINVFKGYPAPIARGAIFMKAHQYLSLEEYKTILEKSDNPVKSHMQIILNLLSEKDKKLLYYISLLNNQEFSKNLLQILLGNDTLVGQNLHNLYKFGLIKNIEKGNNFNLFEMHDSVKDSVLEILPTVEVRKYLTEIIDKINEVMPPSISKKHLFVNSDETLKSNLEVLLKNAEKYQIDIFKVLEIRKNLVSEYMAQLDHPNMEQMSKWIDSKEATGEINIEQMDNKAKTTYAWYLGHSGVFEEFAKANYVKALFFYDKALTILDKIEGEPELKCFIIWQKAQLLAYNGDIANSEKLVKLSEQILKEFPRAEVDLGLYWFLKARIYMSKGDYAAALTAIDKNIEVEAYLPRDSFTAPTFILKSEILNYMSQYEASYQIISAIAKQEIGDRKPSHELHARILLQSSRAKLGTRKIQESLKEAQIARGIYEYEIKKHGITTVENTFDTEYAAILVAEANSLVAINKMQEALTIYNLAEMIYLRRYRENFDNMSDVQDLFVRAALAACRAKNHYWKTHYYDYLLRHFNREDQGIKEVINLCGG